MLPCTTSILHRPDYPLSEVAYCNGHYSSRAAPGLGRGDIDGSVNSLWRYRKALLVDAADAVTMGEGWTPLVRGAWDGVALDFKLEFMMPTGSFKDRGMTVMVSYLKSRGVTEVLEDSSGNAGASLSAYCARAGMRCRILVPETASYPKIAQIAACGADVVTIRGSRQDVADAALAMSRDLFYASHNWQPFFAEGTKTLAYELWEQLNFRAPDSVVVPVGYGANVLGCDRGFSELLRRGEIVRMPRLYGVQAANCAPYYAAFRTGWSTWSPRDRAHRGGRDRHAQTDPCGRLPARCATPGSIVAVERPRSPGRDRPARPLRRAYLRGGRGRAAAGSHRGRHPPAGGHGAGAHRLRAQGLGHHRRPAQAGRPLEPAPHPALSPEGEREIEGPFPQRGEGNGKTLSPAEGERAG
jgi:hypothetical protein